jgi:hypothetical protein
MKMEKYNYFIAVSIVEPHLPIQEIRTCYHDTDTKIENQESIEKTEEDLIIAFSNILKTKDFSLRIISYQLLKKNSHIKEEKRNVSKHS